MDRPGEHPLDPTQVAALMGVKITTHQGGPKGFYCDRDWLISLRDDLSDIGRRCTLAHELGHAYYRHAPVGGYLGQRQERQADEFAARILISPAEYALAEQIQGTDLYALAEELGVTAHIVEVWRKCHTHCPLPI